MIKKKLAVIGASYLQLPLVRKAIERGIEVHCFAIPEGAVCRDYAHHFYPISVTENEEILEVCRKVEIDGVTTIATDLPVTTIAYVSEKLGIQSNSYSTALHATQKDLMKGLLVKNHVNTSKFVIASDAHANLEGLEFPLIVKPVDRSGSRGVIKVDNRSALKDAVEYALDASLCKRALIEEFVQGDEVSVESISYKGEHHIITVTDKQTSGAPNFVEVAHHQPSGLEEQILKRIEKVTLDALNALGIRYGASHTELMVTENDIYVIEVGARMGGDFIGSDLVELSTGFDFLGAVIDIALGTYSLPHPEVSNIACSGVYFLSAQTQSMYPYFMDKNSFDVRKEVFSHELKTIKNSNDRSGYLIYKSSKKVLL